MNATPNAPTVFVVDDDKAVRDSLAWLIESVSLPVRTFDSGRAFLDELDRADGRLSGALIVDVRLPEMSGLDLQDTLARRGVDLPVIVITGHGDVPVAVRAMKTGAFDFIEKPFSDQMLLDRVREAMERHNQHRRMADQLDELRARQARLSTRERQVMDLVVQGKLNKQIAAELDLSPKTVEVHRSHVMTKMEAGSLAELVRYSLMLNGAKTEARA